MVELSYDGSFEGLLGVLAAVVCRGAPLPDRIRRLWPEGEPDQPDLFGPGGGDCPPRIESPSGASISSGAFGGFEETFFELSVGAYDRFRCGWMSEFPIEAACVRFGSRVFAAARAAAERAGAGLGSAEAREAAERASRPGGPFPGDDAVLTVLSAAAKVRREADRLCGFLRFREDERGTFVARCAPDHFVLPLLAAPFSRRFAGAPWLIIDEKRALCLHGGGTAEPRIFAAALPPADQGGDPWEDLWRLYHRSINNPSRNNPGLQRQFIPGRYRKYLPELDRP